MAYNPNTIKTTIKQHLTSISKEVSAKFRQDPPQHYTEDEINEKIAVAITAAFTQFVADARVSIPAQTLTGPGVITLGNGGGPVAGTIIVTAHTGEIV